MMPLCLWIRRLQLSLRGMRFGARFQIEHHLHIRGAKHIRFGDDVFLSDGVSIKSAGAEVRFGNHILLRDGVKIQGGNESGSFLKIGDHFSVNHNTSILFSGGIEIGNYVMIASNVTITSGGHTAGDTERPMLFQPNQFAKVTIEDDVWIGANAVILPGVTLGEGTVVAAGSIVTKSTDPYSIVAGVPAKTIKNRKAD